MAFLSIAAFRHPQYARLWTGAFVSNIGTWMETIAIGVYVTEATGQAAWTGTVAAAAFVPIALLGPLGGAFADRFPRRMLMMTTTLVQTASQQLIDHHDTHRIQLEVYGDNHAAQRAFERAGFQREGTRRRAYWRRDAWQDGVLYGLLADEL